MTLNIGALVDLSHACFHTFAEQKTSILINVASLLGLGHRAFRPPIV